MRNKTAILLGLVIFSLSSCINEKYIFKSNTLYKIQSIAAKPPDTQPTTETNYLLILKPDSGFKANVTDKVDYLIINPLTNHTFLNNLKDSIRIKEPLVKWRADNVGKVYFPETELYKSKKVPFKLWYFDTKPVLQALSIPLKIRPELNSEAVSDSFPSQAQAGFTIGVAGGWKFNFNVYNSKISIFGQNTNRYSIAPGIFIGAGSTRLSKSNTSDPKISFERDAALITTGGFILLGFNIINFGYAIGVDFATGTGGKQWVYQGKIWHGIVVALDILK
jgi:hypothetical protein